MSLNDKQIRIDELLDCLVNLSPLFVRKKHTFIKTRRAKMNRQLKVEFVDGDE